MLKKSGGWFATMGPQGYKFGIEINWNIPLEINYSLPILCFAILHLK